LFSGTGLLFGQYVARTNPYTGKPDLVNKVPISYANGGCNSSTLWTTGSVLFAGASSCAQDNANFFWDNVNKRLGIGTTNPSSLLTVGGRTYIDIEGSQSDTGYPSGVRISQPSTTYQYLTMISHGTYPWSLGIMPQPNNFFGIGTGQNTDSSFVPLFGVDSSGNVGIGITNPQAKLNIISANSLTINDIMFTNDASGNYRNGIANIQSNSSAAGNGMSFRVGDSSVSGQTTVMTLLGNGNVGIGTTIPGEKLAVNGNVKVANTIQVGLYTVATLPTCNGGAEGKIAGATDLLAPTFLTTANGTNWITN